MSRLSILGPSWHLSWRHVYRRTHIGPSSTSPLVGVIDFVTIGSPVRPVATSTERTHYLPFPIDSVRKGVWPSTERASKLHTPRSTTVLNAIRLATPKRDGAAPARRSWDKRK